MTLETNLFYLVAAYVPNSGEMNWSAMDMKE